MISDRLIGRDGSTGRLFGSWGSSTWFGGGGGGRTEANGWETSTQSAVGPTKSISSATLEVFSALPPLPPVPLLLLRCSESSRMRYLVDDGAHFFSPRGIHFPRSFTAYLHFLVHTSFISARDPFNLHPCIVSLMSLPLT